MVTSVRPPNSECAPSIPRSLPAELVASFATHPRGPAEIAPYVALADQLARHEIANLDDHKDRVGLLEEMIVGQVVFATVLTTLRRLAEEHHSHERFGEDRRD